MKAGGQREGLGAVGTQGVAGEPGPAGQDQGGQLLKHPTPLPLPPAETSCAGVLKSQQENPSVRDTA